MKQGDTARAKLPDFHNDEASLHGMWSGTISFSLVAIPVQLVRAVDSGRVSFRLLHSRDYSPLARRMFCPEDETVVQPDDIVRGYEVGPDKYIVMTDEELESVSPERSRTIEISGFIDIQEIDPIYYEHPYYLLPMKGGEKAYRLLVEVLRRTNRAGLAKFVLSGREYLVAVKSTGAALTLITLHYSGDIVSREDIAPEAGKADDREKVRIMKSVRKMMSDFTPDKYADARRKKIVDLLGKKLKTKALVEAPAVGESEEEGPSDLVAALQAAMLKMKSK
ncbi:MAG TPA: Ku protein [Dissulfurispiraceae bacterium]|nr:Ku protein [Dissulfurispiraceae bacterium]